MAEVDDSTYYRGDLIFSASNLRIRPLKRASGVCFPEISSRPKPVVGTFALEYISLP